MEATPPAPWSSPCRTSSVPAVAHQAVKPGLERLTRAAADTGLGRAGEGAQGEEGGEDPGHSRSQSED